MSTPYEAPVPMMRATIELAAHTAGFDFKAGPSGPGDKLGEVAEAVLESAGRFARHVLSPLNLTIELAAHTAGFDFKAGPSGPGDKLGEVAEAVLESAGRFARHVLSPLNR